MSTEVLERFRREYESFHGLSEKRIKSQQKELRAFEAHAGRPLLECEGSDLASYLTVLVERGLHVNTVRKLGNMIRPFYTWAYSAKLYDGNTLMGIRSVKNPRGATANTLPRPYSAKDLQRWRKQLATKLPLTDDFKLGYYTTGRARYARVAKHAQRLQVEAIVALALNCGLRRMEIFSLTIDEVHPENAYVVVRQRGERANGKDHAREAPHTRKSRQAVDRWLAFREVLFTAHPDYPDHGALWLSLSRYQPAPGWMHPASFQRFSQLLPAIGPWELHRFRHTAATNWLRAGMSLELVSRLLGHASITQTLGYAEIVREDIQRAVEEHEDAFDDLIDGEE